MKQTHRKIGCGRGTITEESRTILITLLIGILALNYLASDWELSTSHTQPFSANPSFTSASSFILFVGGAYGGSGGGVDPGDCTFALPANGLSSTCQQTLENGKTCITQCKRQLNKRM